MGINFFEFVDRKQREAIKQLQIIKRILTRFEFQIASHLHNKSDDPYLFVYNPDSTTNFGIRIYKIGNQMAYRIQRKEKTHPYGQARSLDIETMWDDILSDNQDDEGAAKELMQSLADELKDFFKKSAKAEKENRRNKGDRSPLGAVDIRGSTGTDYSNTVTSISR